MNRRWVVLAGVGVAFLAALLLYLQWPRGPRFQEDRKLQADLGAILDGYQKIIVLMDGADSLDEATRARSLAAGRKIFWRKQQAVSDVTQKLSAEYRQAAAGGFRKEAEGIRQFLRFLSANAALRDADKLAFLEIVEELDAITAGLGARQNPLADPLKASLDNLQSIQLAYREEVSRIFSQFATRGDTGKREKWEAYVRFLRERANRARILGELGEDDSLELEAMRGDNRLEIFGYDFAPKTVALTFDDGPHPRYTEQVLALLRKYDAKACFFEVGKNLGDVDGAGRVKLLPAAEISKRALEAGHVLANHTYSHLVLPKLSEAERATEIHRTSRLLEEISGSRPALFRPPYGARNRQILDALTADHLQSVMWTIDALDWADPIAESIALRVMHELNRSHKGIILFHDIHKQTVAALPPVLEELRRQDYDFLTFESGQFVKATKPAGRERAVENPAPAVQVAEAKRKFYRESWAIIIGINDYQQWPKLRYSVNDANAIEEVLIAKFGFKRENVRKLIDGEATRQRIMTLLGDEFSDEKKIDREDRVLFFFAGHGATRTLHDGRQAGFIVPVDADANNYYSTAISMTSLREACDLIPAKHIYFVMDSCYSGLALSRGAGAFAKNRTYLEEITRRTARQILTAGGAEQQVADDGPNGHSVFTWALLQGLQGAADLDGNGMITASELGAYVSPIVASFSKQTPAVGNLVGSEGGEFLFELQPEPLTSLTQQLDGKSLQLAEQLAALEKQVAAKQDQLLKIQQSIQAETAKLTQLAQARGTAGPAENRAARESPVEIQAPGSPAVVRISAPRKKGGAVPAYELDRQGLRFYREKRYDLALQRFQQAVKQKPRDPVLLNNLGFVYYTLGRYDDAVSCLEKTLAIDPKRKEAHGNIADTYLKLGRRDEARTHYEQYLALFPASPRADDVRRVLLTLSNGEPAAQEASLPRN